MLRRPGNGLPMDSYVRRPMTTGLPIVRRRNRLRSLGKRQGIPPAVPMTPLRATAATTTRRLRMSRSSSDGDRRLDVRVRIVSFKGEIVVDEIEDRLNFG